MVGAGTILRARTGMLRCVRVPARSGIAVRVQCRGMAPRRSRALTAWPARTLAGRSAPARPGGRLTGAGAGFLRQVAAGAAVRAAGAGGPQSAGNFSASHFASPALTSAGRRRRHARHAPCCARRSRTRRRGRRSRCARTRPRSGAAPARRGWQNVVWHGVLQTCSVIGELHGTAPGSCGEPDYGLHAGQAHAGAMPAVACRRARGHAARRCAGLSARRPCRTAPRCGRPSGPAAHARTGSSRPARSSRSRRAAASAASGPGSPPGASRLPG